ncbi:Retrovirus-related Pol polyprotein from transposon 17.6 [Trichinella nativa]|uniref:RNA-directed DNA polymerase n=1 Tax=Trichinella nativa TaxID=6335 RepID=A0A0V1L612_9BILA|nr:Retrovirus-related Pol polyprotein from transposon 17.6 [Trichinella nativa]
MKELYGRRVILMHERANFFRITQSDHQTLKQFANSLREAAGHCNLETFNTEAALVLQFINGMKNEEIKLRLLAKENIKLDEALSFLEMYEEIYGCNSRSIMKECYAVQETRGIKPRGVSSCGKQGDLAKVCKHPQKLGKSEKQRPQNSWKDHKLYADGTYAVKERAHNFEVTVKINGSPKRKRATVMLRSFTGHEVNLKGETMVTVEGNEKAIVRVAKNGATNVMGQDWINAFRAAETLRSLLANKKEVNAVESRTQNDVCAEFPVVFEDGFRHCTAHVELKDGVVPLFRKPFHWHSQCMVQRKKRLNDGLMVESYPTLRPEDLYQALRGGKTFTKLDLSEAYLQVELDEESKRIPVINTHKGLYHYNRLPFSVASAPAIFQKVMDTMLAGIPNVAAYLDDIILTGATDDEHRRTLKLVLGRLKEFGLRIRKEKYPKKRTAIVNMPLPTNIAKLRSFLRMYNYYTEFIPKLAEMCSPLNQLLRKDARWKWTGEHTKAVERVKRLLNSPLLLTHYHPEWLIVLAADASNKGIGAVVYHRLSDGTVKVIAHASKKLNAAERNYGQIEKEVLALVYGVKKLHKYLWGRRFTLLTDHKPLVSIFGSKKGVPQMAACRLTRWAIALMNYSFDIEYHSTKNFCQADCLSRLPSSSDELFDANFDHREAEDELTVKQLIVELQAELPVTA